MLKIKSLEDRIHKLREKEDRFSKYDEPATNNNNTNNNNNNNNKNNDNNNNGEMSSPDSTPPVPIKNGHIRNSTFYDTVISYFINPCFVIQDNVIFFLLLKIQKTKERIQNP